MYIKYISKVPVILVCTIAGQASGRAVVKNKEWKVEFGCGIWPYGIRHWILYLAILCSAPPGNHRNKTVCSLHKERNMVKRHSKENQAKTFNTRLSYGSVSVEKIRKLAIRQPENYNRTWTSNFSNVTSLYSTPQQFRVPRYQKWSLYHTVHYTESHIFILKYDKIFSDFFSVFHAH